MGDHGPGEKWIAPEDVPDPIALRGIMIPRPRPALPEVPAAHTGVAMPGLELGSLDPLDPPSLEEVHAPRRGAASRPPPAAHHDELPDAPRPRVPAAAWVGGTLLVIAVLSMGIRLLAGSPGPVIESPATPVPGTGPPLRARASDPVPVDAAPAPAVQQPIAPHRARATGEIPPQASLRPNGESAPPPAVVRPITPPEAASLEPGDAAVNPWMDAEP